MHNFNQFITEASKEGKNVHLEHLEDQVLNRGVVGAREAINFLRSLRDMLVGHSESKVNITTKWDGSPAVFCGINPDNGKFFVGTKGVFANNPKLNYTDEDIDRNHPSEGLRSKLKIALRYLPKLDIKGVIQGDMMFSEDDLINQTIDGEDFITFQPNTIVYAVPVDSNLAKMMKSAKMGIVFHTSYTGKSISDMKASFNVDIGKLSTTKDVWFRDASFVDASGTATFTQQESQKITEILALAGKIFQKLDAKFLNSISIRNDLLIDIKAFNNSKVRAGEIISNTKSHASELIKTLENKYNKNIIDAKKEPTKLSRIAEKNEVIGFLQRNESSLKSIFDLMNLLVDAKLMIVKKLQSINSIGTFVKTDNGFKVTSPEGFVAVDKLKGNAVKLIDRMEFSMQNFTAQKQWTK